MKILIDYIGHADLFFSMHKLFEDRLGHQVFRPNNDPEWSQYGIFTSNDSTLTESGPNYLVNDYSYVQKGISFKDFISGGFDVVITTVHTNEQPFYKIIKDFNLPAKFVRQIANIHEKPNEAPNVMMATTTNISSSYNSILHLPEHRNDFHFTQPNPTFKIKSYYSFLKSYPNEVSLWADLKKGLPQFSLYMHGGNGDDGSVPTADLPNSMQDSMFILHTKPHGGCGYTARQALSCGKPLIVNMSYAINHNTLAKNYMVDGVNCIDVSNKSIPQVIDKILEWSQPGTYEKVVNNVVSLYKEKLNYDENAANIGQWIKGLR